MRKFLLGVCITSMFPLTLTASPADSLPASATALIEQRHGTWRLASSAFVNPAINQWRLSGGFSSVDISGNFRNGADDESVVRGDEGFEVSAGASTYTRYKSSTIWGGGHYTRGHDSHVVWNETADPDIVYPYLMADSVGGNMQWEKYSFDGGYAASSGKWAWGVSASYVALLQYREVDPRPKNVSGILDVSAGMAVRAFADYFAGVGLLFRKYKQSNDLEFKSEMGVDKVFHLTGLASHYARFGGTGMSSSYDGTSWGASLNLFPSSGCGAFVAVNATRFSFRNIITDLNKLPLASAWHNSLDVQAGWLGGRRSLWGVSGSFSAYRRHGRENIFGDATAASYPQIDALTMYADNLLSCSLAGQWGLRFGNVSRFSVRADVGWKRRTTAHLEPRAERRLQGISASVGADGFLSLPRGWLLGAEVSAGCWNPSGCSLSLSGGDREMASLEALESASFAIASARSISLGAGISALKSISSRCLLGLEGHWNFSDPHRAPSSRIFFTALSLIF